MLSYPKTAQLSVGFPQYNPIGPKVKYQIIYSTGKAGTSFYNFEHSEVNVYLLTFLGDWCTYQNLDNKGFYNLRKKTTDLSLKNIENWKRDAYSIIVKKRKVPSIKLQFLYNWLNYKRFNSWIQ